MDINIGIREIDRKTIAFGLARVLADTYTLYLKTHNYHWNVTGPLFNTLHQMFMAQYQGLALTIDEIAERIRALGLPAPGSYVAYSRLSSIPDEDGVPAAEDMLRNLVAGHETLLRTTREEFPNAEMAGDEATTDLLTRIIRTSEKTAWMLRSQIGCSCAA